MSHLARTVALSLVVLALVQAASSASPSASARPSGPARAKQVIVFVGLPGSGKSFAAQRLASRLGTTSFSTGDQIRKTIAARGLPYTAANDRAVALELSATPGELARRTAEEVAADPSPIAVVEGFRTVADVETFTRRFPQTLIVAIEVGTARRHARQLARMRAGEDNEAYLRDRDRSEIRRGQRDVMRRADLRIRPRDDASLDRSLGRVVKAAEAKARAVAPSPSLSP